MIPNIAHQAATDFYYLTGFNEPDATLVLRESASIHGHVSV